jgi:hypothetical protein
MIHHAMVPNDRNSAEFSGKLPAVSEPDDALRALPAPPPAAEVGGPAGPEPTRYGDWELRGRCIDF